VPGGEELTPPVRARLALEELGPTFIKFGQILSTRPDIVPHEFVMEFLKLQDAVPPFPFRDVVKVVESEFKKPVSELFLSIEEEPVAAASIAQVHRAVTASGEEVVIKVQRPGIEAVVENDIAILNYLARLAVRHVPESRNYDPLGMVDEFSKVIRREMDFTLEGSYTARFRENFEGDGRVFIPGILWGLTGRHVLTMERVQGIKVDNVEKLREAGIDTRKTAHLVADVFFKQVFDFGLFHGDLHSGNIFVMGQDKIALVDFGIVGRIDAPMKQHLADILISFVSEDFEGLTKVYQRMGILPESIDKASFEREYYDIMLRYFGRPFKHVKMGELMLDYIRIAARHDIRLPRELLLFDKCIIELEGLARLLFPEANIIKESEPYAARLYSERVNPLRLAKDAAATVSEYTDLARAFPRQADGIMKKVVEDKLRIEFVHRGLEDFMGEMDRSSNRLTFGVIMAALVIGSSLVIASGEKAPSVFGYPLLGVVGFVIASLLGLWIAIQIIRSGKF
ncbi:MAG: AarF/ABC1/UbiB kinase family protein, partial [Deltaproteobacteria bacterium]|nr:AarF/ABC1/UbiB kinase family protein [Deltaproteobacteria bacterium]